MRKLTTRSVTSSNCTLSPSRSAAEPSSMDNSNIHLTSSSATVLPSSSSSRNDSVVLLSSTNTDTMHQQVPHKRRTLPTPVASPTAPPQSLPNNIIKRVRSSNTNKHTASTTVPIVPLSSITTLNPTATTTTTTTTTTTSSTSSSLFDPMYTNSYLASSSSSLSSSSPYHSSHTYENTTDNVDTNYDHNDNDNNSSSITATTTITTNTTNNITPSGSKGKPRVSYAGLKAYGGIGALYWTEEEDTLLRQAVEQIGDTDWTAVAKLVPRRTAQQCLSRWTKALKAGTAKGEWSTHEDNVIKQAVAAAPNGIKSVVWTEVAQELPGRIGKQCRERWLFHLDPSINKDPFTDEEDRILFETQRRIGNKWSEIAQHLPGRNENTVKNRWNSIARRKWFIDKGLTLEERDAKALLSHAKLGHLDHTELQNLQRAASLADPGMPFMNNRAYDIGKGWVDRGSTINQSSSSSSTVTFPSSSTVSPLLHDTSVDMDTTDDALTHSSSSPVVFSSTVESNNDTSTSQTLLNSSTLSNSAHKKSGKRASRIVAETVEITNLSTDTNPSHNYHQQDGNEYSTIVIDLPPGSFYYILGVSPSSKISNKEGYQTMNNQSIYLIVQYTQFVSPSVRRPVEIHIHLTATLPIGTATVNDVQILSPNIISQLAKLGVPGTLVTSLAAINATLPYPSKESNERKTEEAGITESTEPKGMCNLVNSVRDLKLQGSSTQLRRTSKGNRKEKPDMDSNTFIWRLDAVHDTWVKECISLPPLEKSQSDTSSITNKTESSQMDRESRTRDRNTSTTIAKLDPSPIRTKIEQQTNGPASLTSSNSLPTSNNPSLVDTSNNVVSSESSSSIKKAIAPSILPASFITLQTPFEEKSLSSAFPFPSPSNDRLINGQTNMIVDSMTNAGVNPSDLTYSFTVPAAQEPFYGIPIGSLSNGVSSAGLGMPMNALPSTTSSTSSSTPPYSFSKWNALRHNSNRSNMHISGDLSSPTSPPSASALSGGNSRLSTPTAIIHGSLSSNFFTDNTMKENSSKNYNKVSNLSSTHPPSMSLPTFGSASIPMMSTTSPESFSMQGNTFTIPSLSIAPEENNTFVVPALQTTGSPDVPSNLSNLSDSAPGNIFPPSNPTFQPDTSTLMQMSRSLRTKLSKTKQLSISTSTIMVPPTLGTSGETVNMSPNDKETTTVLPRIIPDLLSSRSNSGYAFTVPADVKLRSASSTASIGTNGRSLDSNGGGGIPYVFSTGNMSITSTDLASFPELMGNTPRTQLSNNTSANPPNPPSSSKSSGVAYKPKSKFIFDDIALPEGKE